MFNYNQDGEKYIGIGFAGPPSGKNILSDDAVNMIAIAKKLVEEGCRGRDIDSDPVRFLLAAFDRLDGIFIVAERLFKELEGVPSLSAAMPFLPPPAISPYPSVKAYLDFSTLLYHGASTLDILSKFYTNESGVRHRSGKFRGSKDAIHNTQPPDIRADYLWSDLSRFENEAENIFSEHDGFKGLRNFIAHETSVVGLSAWTFTTHVIDFKSHLCFDCEIEIERKSDGEKKLFPITTTSEKIVSLVSWIVCKTAINYFSRTRTGAIWYNPASIPAWGPEKFIPIWKNNIAVFSNYISSDENEEIFSVMRVTWNGFQPIQRHLKTDVLSKVVTLPPCKESGGR